MLDSIQTRTWHAQFAPDDLAFLRAAIPAAIQLSQDRCARAHAAWDDPDGAQHVYGAGMGISVQKELRSQLSTRPSFREVTVKGTSRKLMYLGDAMLFPLRIAKKMPRDHRHVRIGYMPDARRELFQVASVSKYQQPSLFEVVAPVANEAADLSDALKMLARRVGRESLFVPYYSSVPDGVGSIYWAPARLSGEKYLDFDDPEPLTFVASAVVARTPSQARRGETFADGTRPPTPTKLRVQRNNPRD